MFNQLDIKKMEKLEKTMKKLQSTELWLSEVEDLEEYAGIGWPIFTRGLLKDELRLVKKAQKRLEYVKTKVLSEEDSVKLAEFDTTLKGILAKWGA